MVKKAARIETADDNQLEFTAENMPPASPIGKAARSFQKVCDEIAEVTTALDAKKKEAKAKLLDLMAGEGREAVVVDGITYRKVHKEASDDLRVYSKKKSKQIQNDEEE